MPNDIPLDNDYLSDLITGSGGIVGSTRGQPMRFEIESGPKFVAALLDTDKGPELEDRLISNLRRWMQAEIRRG